MLRDDAKQKREREPRATNGEAGARRLDDLDLGPQVCATSLQVGAQG